MANNLPLKSKGDFSQLDAGAHIWTPSILKEGDAYVCELREMSIEKFLGRTSTIQQVQYDPLDVELKAVIGDEKLITNLRNGFCTEAYKKEILELFADEFHKMETAVRDYIKTLED